MEGRVGMERRRFSQAGEGTSVLGLSLDSVYARSHPAEPLVRRLIGIAQTAGVRLFDTADSVDRRRTEAMMVRVDRLEPGTSWIIGRAPRDLAIGPGTRPTDPGAVALERRLRASLEPIPLRRGVDLWVEWRPGPAARAWDAEAAVALAELEREGRISGWVAYLGELPEDLPGASHSPRSIEISLLDRRWETPLRSPAEPASFLARDPLAGGRLDGTRWDRSLLAPAGRAAPTPLRRLREEAAPVLGLGFLADARGRTLAQSAIQYLVGIPGITSVLAPLPPTERLAELLEFERTPPISEQERARLAAM